MSGFAKVSPSFQRSNQVPLGVKDAETIGGEGLKEQERANITRAAATSVKFWFTPQSNP